MLRSACRSWAELGLKKEVPSRLASHSHTIAPTLPSSTVPHQVALRHFTSKPIACKASGPSLVAASRPEFPCLDANEARTARLLASQGPAIDSIREDDNSSDGPEPSYANVVSGYKIFHYSQPFPLDYGGLLSEFDIAYETWGELNADKTNAILIHTGLSASSHAASHPENTSQGWWEAYIGPGKPLDTNKFFVICTNVLGSCYGSTGPSSKHPLDSEGAPYATRFPILSIFDMVRAQFHLLDDMGLKTLYASLGSSMGGMQSVAAAHLYPDRVQRLVSISGCARSAPASIALRFAQRSVLMSDPNWNRGFYYGQVPPHTGMKLARQIATITYRSGPEWEQRFGRQRRKVSKDIDAAVADPALCPDFLIENYLDYQGEQFCLKYDANSLIYVSKAMDLFDMSQDALDDLERRKQLRASSELSTEGSALSSAAGTTTQMQGEGQPPAAQPKRKYIQTLSSPSAHTYLPSLAKGLERLSSIPTLIMGAQSDILFPIDQQRELAECLRRNGNSHVRYYELDSALGHDSFLIDVENFGGAIKGFLG
ncbi:hypothetical protein CBS101457_003370 [Exobasidium rhododendri]|nr:hypothetical protein CBS101457_003370 [Exobasidium rhododendri]